MNFSKIDAVLLLKITDFFYGLGFFGELIMVILASSRIYGNYFDLLIFFIGLMLNSLLNQTLKPLFKNPRPGNPIKYLAHEKIMKSSNTYGMPSGHSENAFYALTYLYLTTGQIDSWTIMGGIICLVTIMQRYVYHNHTMVQLIAGALFGIGFGLLIRGNIDSLRNISKI
jgi:membrane-associated phospholipid phosphatase